MYLEFFELKEFPFNITPDPRFLFYTARHREAFDLLVYGVENRKGFIELTGEVGSGKTTICRAVLSRLSPSIRTALILNPSLSETQLLRAILNDLGLPLRGRDRLSHIEQLNHFLLEQLREGCNVAVIIDEAQDLLPGVMEQIRLLSNLETDQQKLLQIVLVGQPELHERLSRPDLRQLRQRIIVRCNLCPLTEDETGQYVAHRLAVAGAAAEVYFDRMAIQGLFKHTQGIPRVTNTVCDRAMMAGFVAGTRCIRAAEIEKALADLEGRA